jgi:hypothetical protein
MFDTSEISIVLQRIEAGCFTSTLDLSLPHQRVAFANEWAVGVISLPPKFRAVKPASISSH